MCVLSGDVATLQINRCQATGANTLTHTYAHAPICRRLQSYLLVKEIQMQVVLQKLLL